MLSSIDIVINFRVSKIHFIDFNIGEQTIIYFTLPVYNANKIHHSRVKGSKIIHSFGVAIYECSHTQHIQQ